MPRVCDCVRRGPPSWLAGHGAGYTRYTSPKAPTEALVTFRSIRMGQEGRSGRPTCRLMSRNTALSTKG